MGRFLDVLDEQGSLLSPGRSIWTTSALSDLSDRVVGHPDFGAGSFIDKLVRQTRQASPAVIQLAGEALFVFHLKDAETPATTKRLEIQRILAGLPDPPTIPNDLAEAMESGVARYGLGKLHKWPHFTYLLRFSSRWLELSSNERTRLREDAWAFRDFLEQIKVRAGGFQQDAILHLVHPAVFEPIISRGDKRAIVRAYEDQITEPTSDPDRALQQIRASLAKDPALGQDFNFYLPQIRERCPTHPEVHQLLDGLPRLLRQLATTTAHQEEHSAERVRGAILWGSTIAARAAGGLPHLYVTAPAQRAFQTPENELLVFVLDAIAQIGQQTGWLDRDGQGIRQLIGDRTAAAQRWRQARMLLEVERRPPTPRAVSRVRTGRHNRRYRHAINTWERYRSLIAQLDRAELRNLIESTAIVTRDNPTLFELLCTFAVIDALQECGWQSRPLRLFHGQLQLTAQRGQEHLDLWYQTTPRPLVASSRYTKVLRQHRFANPSGLRPDMVLRQANSGQERWLLVEAKLYGDVQDGARAALQNLLAYRRAFDTDLATNSGIYGLGIAWGTDLQPAPTEVMLCTPDTIPTAIRQFVG